MLAGLIPAGLLQTTPEVREFMGAIVLSGPEDTIKQLSSLTSGSHNFFFSQDASESFEEGVVLDVLFRDEHISPQCTLMSCLHNNCEKTLLGLGVESCLICGQKLKYLEDSLMICLFSQTMTIGLFP